MILSRRHCGTNNKEGNSNIGIQFRWNKLRGRHRGSTAKERSIDIIPTSRRYNPPILQQRSRLPFKLHYTRRRNFKTIIAVKYDTREAYWQVQIHQTRKETSRRIHIQVQHHRTRLLIREASTLKKKDASTQNHRSPC